MRARRNGPVKRLLRRFLRRQDGTAAVEFALVGLPFFWLLFVAIETAGVVFTDTALENGVIETARLIRTGQVQTQGISASKFKELLCQNVASYIKCDKIRIYINKSASLPVPSTDVMAATDDSPQAFQPGGPMEWVMVQVYYDWKLVVPGISHLANKGSDTRRLVAGALFRNEPYGG